ncbi:cystatin domain protein [Ancylostoma duodenale]|uniref:Cystatin domain protein n=1 Tax=Ancylostoma duodenale TaxID=51022 RepID=A0A0C2CC62_9BILA|nr:cystatin domain protein [Ancylostoma duodenale]
MPGLPLVVAVLSFTLAVHGHSLFRGGMTEAPNDLEYIAAVHGDVVPGAVMTEDPNDPEYMEKAWKAALTLNQDSDLKYLMVPIKVVKADSRVVAGIKHTFEALFGQSGCIKGVVELAKLATAKCQPIPDGSRALYKVVHFVRPWANCERYTVSKIRDVAAVEEL